MSAWTALSRSRNFSGQPTAPGRSHDGHYRLGAGCDSFGTARVNCQYAVGEDCNTFNCNTEWDEWNVVRAQVLPADAVIEFGARFGTTSCVLAEATRNSGRVVAVEPDARAHSLLLTNRERNRCNFAAVLGTVSDRPLVLSHLSAHHYDQLTRVATSSDEAVLPNVHYRDLERALGTNFTAALIDCEGCIGIVNASGLLAGPSMRLVMLEEDQLGHVRYRNVWYASLRHLGYRRVWNAFSRTATVTDRHSAWVRGGLIAGPSCAHFRSWTSQPPNALRCLDNEGDDELTFREWRARSVQGRERDHGSRGE